MANQAVLERREDTAGGTLDLAIERQIESLLEEAERIEDSTPIEPKKDAQSGYWRFRMPQAGVRYYSF